MAVAPAVDLDEALVIAAGRDRALKQIERCHDSLRNAWMLDADRPGRSVGMRPDDLNVAAKIDQAVAKACLRAERRGAIRRVFLDHAAEVDFHSSKTEHESRALPADLVPAHARKQALQRVRVGQLAAIRAPDFAQDARGQVEQPVALLVAGGAIVE